jgi:hypothetical protein
MQGQLCCAAAAQIAAFPRMEMCERPEHLSLVHRHTVLPALGCCSQGLRQCCTDPQG